MRLFAFMRLFLYIGGMGPRTKNYIGMALMLSALESDNRGFIDSLSFGKKYRPTPQSLPSAEKRKQLRAKRKKRKLK
jgi:hypothetical protein